MKKIFFFSFIFLLASCGKTIGILEFREPKLVQKSIQIDPQKELQFWTDLDIEFSGKIYFVYKIKILKDTKLIDEIFCDPFNVSIRLKSMRTAWNNNYTIKYEGKMRCAPSAVLPETFELEVTPEMHGNITSLRRYDLILKQ